MTSYWIVAILIFIIVAAIITLIVLRVRGSNGGGGGSNGGGSNGGGSNGGRNGGGRNGGGSNGGGSNGGGGSDPNGWVSEHNKYRQPAHSLAWDSDLAAQSLAYANQLASSRAFKHGDMCNPVCRGSNCGGGRTCGQNLEIAIPSTSPIQAVGNWYAEKSKYRGGCDSNPSACADAGHYTQLVWKNAKKVGCGISDNSQIAACLYDIGNEIGQFSENVPNNYPSTV
jgi:hypothetical protein